MSRRIVATAFAASLLFAHAAAAQQQPQQHFVSPDNINLTRLLIAPPARDSAQTAAELEELRAIQRARTPERLALADADARQENVWRFAGVMGAGFTAERLPRVAALFAVLVEDEDVTTDGPKHDFARPRPYQVINDLASPCPRPSSGSYPSGHATIGYYMAGVLASMVPERRDAIMARAWEFAESRLVCGVHYRSDLEAGRISGIAMAAVALSSPRFQEPYTQARSELRAALGLSN
jgi:acid phosphatase (class A)